MSKSKLTKQQLLRVKNKQKRDIEDSTSISEQNDAERLQGRVVAHYGKRLDIETIDKTIVPSQLRRNLGNIAVGDDIIYIKNDSENFIVIAIKPRRSELYRFHKYEGNKLIAANLDKLYIVFAAEPERSINAIDRYIVLAENYSIKPVLVLNKIDLLEQQENLYHTRLCDYQQLGYETFATSIHRTDTLNPLNHSLMGKISLFVGVSGVGKSSLIQALLPDENLEIGSLSEKSAEGMHTTTTAKLYHFPQGGDLIDCPGIRELSIGKLTTQQILKGFKELNALATNCQFRDCSHQHEPDCAILKAEKKQTISLERLTSYRKMIAETDHN